MKMGKATKSLHGIYATMFPDSNGTFQLDYLVQSVWAGLLKATFRGGITDTIDSCLAMIAKRKALNGAAFVLSNDELAKDIFVSYKDFAAFLRGKPPMEVNFISKKNAPNQERQELLESLTANLCASSHESLREACLKNPPWPRKIMKFGRPMESDKHEARRLAFYIWDDDKTKTIEAVIKQLKKETRFRKVNSKVLRDWIKDLAPNRKPGRRKLPHGQ